MRDTLQARITELVHNQAASYQVKATIDYGRGYPVLVNTPAETDFARQVAVELVGADKVDPQTRPLTGSEDFAFMLEDVPGSYLLGVTATGRRTASTVDTAPAWSTTRAMTSTTTACPWARRIGCC